MSTSRFAFTTPLALPLCSGDPCAERGNAVDDLVAAIRLDPPARHDAPQRPRSPIFPCSALKRSAPARHRLNRPDRLQGGWMTTAPIEHWPVLAGSARVAAHTPTVGLSDGRSISVPLLWYRRLAHDSSLSRRHADPISWTLHRRNRSGISIRANNS